MKKFSKKLEQLIDFVNFTHEFREVIRVARSPHNKRFENDTEHSYQLAMAAWFLIEQDELNLNTDLWLMYALAHDLVEVYAGDTYSFDKEKVASQQQREKEALRKIQKRFPFFKTLIKIIKKYEDKKDEESKFIYALDKILPMIQNYLEKGKLQRSKKVSMEDFLQTKDKKVALSPDIEKYYREIKQEFVKNKKMYFIG